MDWAISICRVDPSPGLFHNSLAALVDRYFRRACRVQELRHRKSGCRDGRGCHGAGPCESHGDFWWTGTYHWVTGCIWLRNFRLELRH